MTWNSAIGAMPIPTMDYYTFAGWFTEAEGGTQVTEETVMTSLEDITLFAHWTQNAVSDWVLASEAPEESEIVSTKWSYSQTTNTDSQEPTLEGYTLTGSDWVQSGSGSQNWASFPKGYNSNDSYYKNYAKSQPYAASETETAKREVSNNWAGYVYWHWMYDCGGASAGNRTIYDHVGTASYNNYYYDYWGSFTSTSGYTANGTDYSCGSYGYKTYSGTGRTTFAQSQGTKYWYRFDYYLCSYTDYYKLFHYTKTEELESATDPTGGEGVSNVQQWVQYRAK